MFCQSYCLKIFILIAPIENLYLMLEAWWVRRGFYQKSLVIYSLIQLTVTDDDVQSIGNLPCILWPMSQSEEEHSQ